MNNKGLEALAALAAVAPTPGSVGGNGSRNEVSGSGRSNERTGNQTQLSGIAASQVANGQQGWPGSLSSSLNAAALAPLLSSLQSLPAQGSDTSSIISMQQQVNLLNYLMKTQSNQQPAATPPPSTGSGSLGSLSAIQNQALQLALAGRSAASLLQNTDDPSRRQLHQVLPGSVVPMPPSSQEQPQQTTEAPSPSTATMPPPQNIHGQAIKVSTSSVASQNQPTSIAPQPAYGTMSIYSDSSSSHSGGHHQEDKKQLKRAANRRSAQLSRKRKKLFIEELKEENDDLRRKEQILKSIPDLIVVFDSSGKLRFVSESVNRFLCFTASELEGTSFWDRLCEDSVRLLKAAFMDSLAARQPNSDTAPLGSGLWELRLVDKNGSHNLVSLNGVVHFAGERPECVCSIRPKDDASKEVAEPDSHEEAIAEATSNRSETVIRSKHQQSVISTGQKSHNAHDKIRGNISPRLGKRGEAVRISDSGNSSGDSECGSSDELTGTTS